MDSGFLSSNSDVYGVEEKGIKKTSLSNQINTSSSNIQHPNIKSGSFTVDMERFSDKVLVPNSRITLQRNLSRKGLQRGGDQKKLNSSGDVEEREAGGFAPYTSSPRAALEGASTPEKPIVVTMGATNQPFNKQMHHQITIMTTAPASTTTTTTTTTETKLGGRRFSFKRSSPSWTIDPRKILFFFATLSSMGTILLIYFTLTMGKHSGNDDTIN